MKLKVFTTETCHKCPAVKKAIEELLAAKIADFTAEFINAHSEEGLKEARKYNISQVPTVILFQKDQEIARIHSVDDLKKNLVP